jgi:cbb3-type cytochrome oxidase cytochrome c subunit
MKGLAPLFLGVFGTFLFSWAGLALIPNLQIGSLNPQSKDEGADVYPLPQSGMAERGLQVYNANGCAYCHSRSVRPDYAASDLDRKWGNRRSAPRDYLFERPVLLGKMRTGPDLSNIGQRTPLEDENAAPAATASPGTAPQGAAVSSPPAAATSAAGQPPTKSPAPAAGPAGSAAAGATPAATAQQPSSTSSLGSENKPNEAPMYSATWHHRHLYSPRSVTLDSIMPSYKFLYEKRPITGQPSADALKLTGADAPPDGWEIIPTYDAQCLVAFLISSNHSTKRNPAEAEALLRPDLPRLHPPRQQNERDPFQSSTAFPPGNGLRRERRSARSARCDSARKA